MILTIFTDVTPLEDRLTCERLFSGVLDSPSADHTFGKEGVVIAGWLIPNNNSDLYELCIEGVFGTVNSIPQTPRPDVAQIKNASPMAGQAQFNGFSARIPLSEIINISICIGGEKILWKVLKSFEIDTDLDDVLLSALAHGTTHSSVQHISGASYRVPVINGVFERVKLHRLTALSSMPLDEVEKGYFVRFVEYISAPDFFSKMLMSHKGGAGIMIPSPFSLSWAVLVGSIFAEVNYLVFEVDGQRFFVGQNLHSADFVYFPSRSFVCHLPVQGSIYEHIHVKALIECVSQKPELFAAGSGQVVGIRDVLLNGVSPYHFFYDTLPAIYLASCKGGLESVKSYLAIDSRCYLALDKLYSLPVEVNTISTSVLRERSWGTGHDALCVAGVNFKSLSDLEISKMDAQVVGLAAADIELTDKYADLVKLSPLIWLGISAQKRSWVNQEDVLIEVIERISNQYPGYALVIDGMTSNMFESGTSVDFAADQDVVNDLVGRLSGSPVVISLVGCSSLEKIFVSSKCDFFISNYSTGSMYPARFSGLPGVAHLSKAMMEVVENMHIHRCTVVVPEEAVTDIPDLTTHRLDFVSYSVDSQAFGDLAMDVMKRHF